MPHEPNEVVVQEQSSAVMAQNDAQIKALIDVAHQYPRDEGKVIKNIEDSAYRTPEMMNACFFHMPVGDGVIGPSIRLAEIIAANYGNLVVQTMTVQETPKQVTVRGQAWNLESNYMQSTEVTQRLTDRAGRPYAEGVRISNIQAAHAKARRQVILQIVPQHVWKHVYETCLNPPAADERTPMLTKMMAWLTNNQKIERDRILTYFGVTTITEITDEQLTELRAIGTSLKEEQIDPDRAFYHEQQVVDPDKAERGNAALKKKVASNKAEPEIVTDGSWPHLPKSKQHWSHKAVEGITARAGFGEYDARAALDGICLDKGSKRANESKMGPVITAAINNDETEIDFEAMRQKGMDSLTEG